MKVIYDTENLDLLAPEGSNLLEICLKNKVPLSHSCEGMASCGTCRVIVTEGLENLPARNELEWDMANDRGFQDEERLACQIVPSKNLNF